MAGHESLWAGAMLLLGLLFIASGSLYIDTVDNKCTSCEDSSASRTYSGVMIAVGCLAVVVSLIYFGSKVFAHPQVQKAIEAAKSS